jgi:hypothetical protein
MTLEAFTSQVMAALGNEPECKGLSDDELRDVMDEYADIIEGCYEDSQAEDANGDEWHIKNAAMNIAMCV